MRTAGGTGSEWPGKSAIHGSFSGALTNYWHWNNFNAAIEARRHTGRFGDSHAMYLFVCSADQQLADTELLLSISSFYDAFASLLEQPGSFHRSDSSLTGCDFARYGVGGDCLYLHLLRR